MQHTPTSATFDSNELAHFATALFGAAGLSEDRASIVARMLLEADLLGFTTHGFNRIAANLEWLVNGDTDATGEPTVLVDQGPQFHWDAHRLPGPWVMACAVREASQRAFQHGVATALLRDCQHIACLASYLIEPVQQGLVVQIVASSPDDRCVAPFGGRDPVFSPNPFAFGAPTGDVPVLIDMSFSEVAEGYVARARDTAERMSSHCLLTAEGLPSDDPADYWADPKGSLLPLGGLDYGYKGSALSLWSELITLALGNRGRRESVGYSEANTVFLQIIDPDAFGSRAGFELEAGAIADLCRQSRPRPGYSAVRVPGDRAWHSRRQQLEEGVDLHPLIMPKIEPWAHRFGVDMPQPIRKPDRDR